MEGSSKNIFIDKSFIQKDQSKGRLVQTDKTNDVCKV